jgi:hypothetical protein
MTRRFTAVVLVVFATLAAGRAAADPIYSTYSPFVPGPGAWAGALDAIGIVEDAYGAVLHTDRQVASSFVVSAPWTVSSYSLVVDIFNYEYGLNGRLSLWSGDLEPTALVEAPIDFVAPTIYPAPLTIASVAHPLLDPGVTYWLLVQAADGDGDRFSWGVSSLSTGHRLARADGGDWATAGTPSAFEIEGTSTPVPEPATMLLVGAGLIVLGRVRRRRA